MTADPPEDPRAATAPGRPPAGRYGPDRAARPGWVPVLLGATLVAAIVLAAWLGLRTGSVPIEGHDVGFRVLGDDAVVVTFDVTRAEPGRAATCRIEALNSSHAQVGVIDVDVASAEHERVRLSATVRTSERAVSATVTRCQVVD